MGRNAEMANTTTSRQFNTSTAPTQHPQTMTIHWPTDGLYFEAWHVPHPQPLLPKSPAPNSTLSIGYLSSATLYVIYYAHVFVCFRRCSFVVVSPIVDVMNEIAVKLIALHQFFC